MAPFRARRGAPTLVVAGLVATAALLLALVSGSITLGPRELLGAFGGEGIGASLVWELRLPRALNAFAVGALLALAGALLQVLLHNPLADPYVLGVSGGAAAGALLATLLGVADAAGAGVGALSAILLVFTLARDRGSWSPTRLLLVGVVLAAGWGALINFVLALAPEGGVKGMLFWLMGDLSHGISPWPALGVLALGLAATLPLARHLNLLARGELTAAALGVEVGGLRLYLYLTAAVLTATAVTVGGSIGFVGLVVPHLLRLLSGSDHRLLLPAAALAGGALLTLADTLARTVIAPQQLPVGILTALIGVPLFLYLLLRNGRTAR